MAQSVLTDIHSLIIQYLSYCCEQKNLSSSTMKGYSIDLQQFEQAVYAYDQPLGRESLNQYCRYLNMHYMPRSAKRKIASAKAFCRWLEFEGVVEDYPFRKVNTKTRELKQIPRYLSLESMKAILEHVYQLWRTAARWKPAYRYLVRDIAILELLFATGVRVSELCSLKKDDIQYAPPSIRVVGKGSKERIIPIENMEVLQAIDRCEKLNWDLIQEKGYVFYNQKRDRLSPQSVRNMVAKYAKGTGITYKVTPHMIRHSFATLMLESDVDIRYIQKLLGHSSIRTTEIYTSVTNMKERQIIATKHPRNSFQILQVNTTLSCKCQE